MMENGFNFSFFLREDFLSGREIHIHYLEMMDSQVLGMICIYINITYRVKR